MASGKIMLIGFVQSFSSDQVCSIEQNQST
jgi:hypothetical protein